MIPSSWDWQKKDSALIETPLQLKQLAKMQQQAAYGIRTALKPAVVEIGTGFLAPVPIRFYELTKQAEQDLMTLVGLREHGCASFMANTLACQFGTFAGNIHILNAPISKLQICFVLTEG